MTGALKLAHNQEAAASLKTELKARVALPDAPNMPQVLSWAGDSTGIQGVLYEPYDCTLEQCIRKQHTYATNHSRRKPTATAPLFPPPQYHAIIRALLETLVYAHAHGVYHCDVKPSNILCRADGRIGLSDWGLAKIVADCPAGHMIDGPYGSPRYMPDELCEKNGSVPPNATLDTFPLAVVAVELILGWGARSVRKWKRQGKLEELLPVEVSSLLTAALSADRSARPTVEEWLQVWPRGAPGPEVARAIRAMAVSAHVITPPPAEPAPCARGPQKAKRARDASAPFGGILASQNVRCVRQALGRHGSAGQRRSPASAQDSSRRGAPVPAPCGHTSSSTLAGESADLQAPTASSEGSAASSSAEGAIGSPAECPVRRTRSACSGPDFDSIAEESLTDSDASRSSRGGCIANSIAEGDGGILAPGASPVRRTRSACSGPDFDSIAAETLTDSNASRFSSEGSAASSSAEGPMGSLRPAECPVRRSRSACSGPAFDSVAASDLTVSDASCSSGALSTCSPPSTFSTTDPCPHSASSGGCSSPPVCGASRQRLRVSTGASTGGMHAHCDPGDVNALSTSDTGTWELQDGSAAPPSPQDDRGCTTPLGPHTPIKLHLPGSIAPDATLKPISTRPSAAPLLPCALQSLRCLSAQLPQLQSVDTTETPHFDGGSDISSALASSPCRRFASANYVFDCSLPSSPDVSPRVLSKVLRQASALRPLDRALPCASEGAGCAANAGELTGALEGLRRDEGTVAAQALSGDGGRGSMTDERSEDGLEATLSEDCAAVEPEGLGLGTRCERRRRWRRGLVTVLLPFLWCVRRSACTPEQ